MQHIRLNRGVSRIAAAGSLGLDRSTLTRSVRSLMDSGLVRETGKYRGKPGSGRMATGLEVDPGFGLVLGIEAQTERLRWALVDLYGEIADAGSSRYGAAPGGLEDQLAALVASVRARMSGERRPLVGVGIGLSGVVDPYGGIIVHSYPLGIVDTLPLRDRLEAGLGVPVFVENDANCCCWSELAFRRTPENRNFIALLGEFRNIDVGSNRRTGIAFGIGISIRDSVFHGDNFTAGEFRSLLYDHGKPSHSQFSITDEDAARLPGDRAVLDRVFRELAYNVSLIANTFDITKIVVTGDFAGYPDILSPHLERELARNWLYQTPRKCAIEYPNDGDRAVSLGAAGLVVKKLFSVPGMTDHLDEEVGAILLDRMRAL